MTLELLVGLTVKDDETYAEYRRAMAPLLAEHGGGFRVDFAVSRVFKSESDHPINRVFVIFFADGPSKERFFAHPTYKEIKARFFERSVAGTTIISEYERSPGADGALLLEATRRLSDGKARLAQAEAWFEGASGHEKPESYEEMQYWSRQVADARAAWRALAGPDAPEPL